VDAFYTRVADLVASHTGRPASEVREQLTPPKQPEHGDIALPCFKLAQTLGRAGKDAAPALAKELAGVLASAGPPIVAAEAAGPFLNVRLDPAAITKDVVDAVLTRPIYGGSDEGAERAVVIDFSSPNIAKPFHLGHLRSTVIGWSLRQIFRALGYTVVGVNHLGDWGTQFGLMMAAWKRYPEGQQRIDGGERDIDVFYELYVRINKLKKAEPAVAEEGRAWFKRLESGDAEARRLWRFFVDRSKAEFQRIYDILGIVHESDSGEAFYEDKMPAMVAFLETSGLLVEGKSRVEELAALKQESADARDKGAAARAELATATDDKKKKELEKRAKQLEARSAELAKKAKNLEAQLAAPADEEEGDDAGPADRRPRGIVLPRGKDKEPAFCMLLKGDGGTTYATRDLTAVRYRSETYEPAQVLYVVGNTQRDHFIPVFEVVDRLGKEKGQVWAQGLALNHIGFGNYLGMSTRGGTAVFLEQVIERSRVAAHEAAASAEKKLELTDAQRESVARSIGVGGLKFFDLKGARTNDIDLSKPLPAPADGLLEWVHPATTKDQRVEAGAVVARIKAATGETLEVVCEGGCGIKEPAAVGKPITRGQQLLLQDGVIDWDRLLSLKGDSGPYLQFAHARLAGILRRLGGPPAGTEVDGRALSDAEAQALLKSIAAFPGKVRQAAAEHEPSVIARYLLELSAKIHQFVHARRVLDAAAEGDVPAEAVRWARALLVVAAKKVLAEGLSLLGIEAVEVM